MSERGPSARTNVRLWSLNEGSNDRAVNALLPAFTQVANRELPALRVDDVSPVGDALGAFLSDPANGENFAYILPLDLPDDITDAIVTSIVSAPSAPFN